MTRKRKIALAIIASLLVAIMLFFAVVIFVLTQTIGITTEIVAGEVINEIAEGVVSGLHDTGKNLAEEVVSDCISSVFGE